MNIFKTIKDIRNFCETLTKNKSLGFVPTMGSLHKAHTSLIKKARDENDITVVSIFVNPTQFNQGEDFEAYPKPFNDDVQLCKSLGVNAVFSPSISELYNEKDLTVITVKNLTKKLCGKLRPGHFEGVLKIVSKLFNIINPHRAYFGQKDYQQFKVIEQMIIDLNFNTELVLCPTVREEDGLALSSRNRYLNQIERKDAAEIFKALTIGKKLILNGEKSADIISAAIKNNLKSSRIEYAGVYDTANLNNINKIENDVLLAAALWIGKARLIDNLLYRNFKA